MDLGASHGQLQYISKLLQDIYCTATIHNKNPETILTLNKGMEYVCEQPIFLLLLLTGEKNSNH